MSESSVLRRRRSAPQLRTCYLACWRSQHSQEHLRLARDPRRLGVFLVDELGSLELKRRPLLKDARWNTPVRKHKVLFVATMGLAA